MESDNLFAVRDLPNAQGYLPPKRSILSQAAPVLLAGMLGCVPCSRAVKRTLPTFVLTSWRADVGLPKHSPNKLIANQTAQQFEVVDNVQTGHTTRFWWVSRICSLQIWGPLEESRALLTPARVYAGCCWLLGLPSQEPVHWKPRIPWKTEPTYRI